MSTPKSAPKKDGLSVYTLLAALELPDLEVSKLYEVHNCSFGDIGKVYPGVELAPKNWGGSVWRAVGPKESISALKYDLEKKRFAGPGAP